MPAAVRICRSPDVAEEGRLVVDIGAETIGLFRLDGRLFAYQNVCPHQGGPVCQGTLVPRVVESDTGSSFHSTDRHIVCPWHGFEFDIRTGAHAGGGAFHLTPVEVRETRGEVFVHLP